MTTIDLDELCDQFESQWSVERSGVIGVAAFLSAKQIDAGVHFETLTVLCTMDLERAWMAWNAWLPKNVTASAADIIARFQSLPTLSQYRSRWGDPDNVLWQRLAESELQVRDRWGDAIGALYFSSLFGYEFSSSDDGRARHLTIELDEPAGSEQSEPCEDRFRLRGEVTIGRQRSTDEKAWACQCLAEGNRITIAGQHETAISRTQLKISLLHPNYALVTNTCNPAFPSPMLVYGRALCPDRPVLAKFPFAIKMPGRKLILQ